MEKVKTLLLQNKLMVNDNETILMLLGSPYWLSKLNLSSIQMGNIEIETVDDVIFDDEMNFEKHNIISTIVAKV